MTSWPPWCASASSTSPTDRGKKSNHPEFPDGWGLFSTLEGNNGLARNAKGHWVATHMGQRVTFTEQRFGDAAELLARRVLLAMQAGTYDELRDSALLKQSYSRELAAQMLGIHVGELNEWLLSGVLRGQEITLPRPDNR